MQRSFRSFRSSGLRSSGLGSFRLSEAVVVVLNEATNGVVNIDAIHEESLGRFRVLCNIDNGVGGNEERSPRSQFYFDKLEMREKRSIFGC